MAQSGLGITVYLGTEDSDDDIVIVVSRSMLTALKGLSEVKPLTANSGLEVPTEEAERTTARKRTPRIAAPTKPKRRSAKNSPVEDEEDEPAPKKGLARTPTKTWKGVAPTPAPTGKAAGVKNPIKHPLGTGRKTFS